jgi:VIT1/CCC1 family predicted Fe2+/Mn2+ transporter
METLLIITSVLAGLCLIAIVFRIAKFVGAHKLKQTLNKMTVREMLVHKRDKFRSL